MGWDNGRLDEEEIRGHVHNARDATLPGVIASDVQARRLRWLWPGRLPLGMFCGLEGDPGEGKSLICVDIAARVSTGREFPDGTKCTPGSVIIISGEDDPAVTLRPRLEAASADLSRVCLWTKNLPALPGALKELLRVIKADRAKLLVLDPVDCFYGDKIDPNANPSVRRVLQPLADRASELGCTILGVRHLNKDSKVGKAIYRGSGSIGFAGQARAVFLANPTRENSELRAFARVKGNLSKPPPTLGYRIVEATVTAADGSEINTQKIEWCGTLQMTADDLLREPEPQPRGPKPEKLEAAKAFLREVLADGLEHTSDGIIAEAKGQGISKGRLYEAANELRVKRRKAGFAGDWLWCLPIGAPGNSDSLVNPFSQKGFDEESKRQRNSGSSSEKLEDPEFHGNNSDSSPDPFSPNDFINSKDPEKAEDSEFPGGLVNQFGADPSNREAEDGEIDRLAAADGWKPDEEERF